MKRRRLRLGLIYPFKRNWLCFVILFCKIRNGTLVANSKSVSNMLNSVECIRTGFIPSQFEGSIACQGVWRSLSGAAECFQRVEGDGGGPFGAGGPSRAVAGFPART